MGVIQVYLDDEYGGELDDDDRWARRTGEYHASETRSCPRKLYWKYTDAKPTEPSPYFELGHVFESIYGRALGSVHGSEYVLQDVTCEIELSDEITLVGESDWCVLREPFDGDLAYHIDTSGTRYEIRDGEARIVDPNDEESDPPLVDEVIETKTTKDASWKRGGPDEKHVYQLMTYLHATDSDGRVVYMERNDLTEVGFDVDYQRGIWNDIVYRMHTHHANITERRGEIPPTDPLDDSTWSSSVPSECRFCDYRSECRSVGGDVWDSVDSTDG